jgi:hypothetical protein
MNFVKLKAKQSQLDWLDSLTKLGDLQIALLQSWMQDGCPNDYFK